MINNNSELTFEYILSHLNKVVLCRKANGKEFIARLVDIDDDYLVFENKKGNRLQNLLENIVYMAEL